MYVNDSQFEASLNVQAKSTQDASCAASKILCEREYLSIFPHDQVGSYHTTAT